MFIKCKCNREGGSVIQLDETEYHFAPDSDGNQVAEVTNQKHINRFLEISEAYEELGAKGKKKVAATVDPAGPEDGGDDSGGEVTAAEINAMGKKELLALAADNNVPVNGNAPVSTLRKSLIKALVA